MNPTSSTALERLRDHSNANADWSEAGSRLAPQAWPSFNPQFIVPAGGSVFTVGSCFARNIEEHVSRLGFDVPTLAFSVPHTERSGGRGNAILNKYTPAAIRQEFDWVRRVHEAGGQVTPDHVAPLTFMCSDGSVIDLQLGGFRPVSPERLIARRQELYDVFRHLFTADCVVLTLGLIEAWRDETTGLYIQQAPVHPPFRRSLSRFTFHRLPFTACLAEVQGAIDTVRAVNPAANVLITTSPVPLDRTFTADDVITATMHGKSVLRAVCGEIVAANERVDYFPSYESVMLTRDWSVFQADRRHVSDAFVGRIVQRLLDTYFREAPPERRMAHAAYMASLAGESADATALRSLWEASPQDMRAFAHYLNALAKTPADLAAATATYVEAGPAPEQVARLARTAKRDLEDAASVLGALVAAVSAVVGTGTASPVYAEVWRLWVQALMREDRFAEAAAAIADASLRWPGDVAVQELATLVSRRARRAGVSGIRPAASEQAAPQPSGRRPVQMLAAAVEAGDPATIAARLAEALDAGATPEAVVEIAHQAKRAARDGIVSPRLALLRDAVVARAAGSTPDVGFAPLWRMLTQALWREGRGEEALAAATAAADLWPENEDVVETHDGMRRKIRKQARETRAADEPVRTVPPKEDAA